MRIDEHVTIRRTPEEVWDFVIDHLNDTRWCNKVITVERDGDTSWKIWHKPVPLRPPALLTTTHLREDRPVFVAIREEDDASVFNVEYRLERTPDGTMFTQVSEFEWKRLPRLLRPVFAFGVRRDIAGQLRALKRELERD